MPFVYGLIGFIIGAASLFFIRQKKIVKLEKELRQYKRQIDKYDQEYKSLDKECEELTERLKELKDDHQAEKEELEDAYQQRLNQLTQKYENEIESLTRLTQKQETPKVQSETFEKLKLQPTRENPELSFNRPNITTSLEEYNPFEETEEREEESKTSNLRLIPENQPSIRTSGKNFNPFEVTDDTENDFQVISVADEHEVASQDYATSFISDVTDSEATEFQELDFFTTEEVEELPKASLETSELTTITSDLELNFDTSPGQTLQEPEPPEAVPIGYDTEIIDFEEIYLETSTQQELQEPELPEAVAISYDTEIIDFEEIYLETSTQEIEPILEAISQGDRAKLGTKGDQHFVVNSDSDISDFEELYSTSTEISVDEPQSRSQADQLPGSTSDTEIIDFQELHLDSLDQGVIDDPESLSQDEQLFVISSDSEIHDFELAQDYSQDLSASHSELLALIDSDDSSGKSTNSSNQEQRQVAVVDNPDEDEAEGMEFIFDDFDSPSLEDDENLITDSQMAQFMNSDDSDSNQRDSSAEISFDDLFDTKEPQPSTDNEEKNDLQEINFNDEDFLELLSESFYQNETEIKLDKNKKQ